MDKKRFSLGNPLDYKPDWKSMSFPQKIGYIWDYYKLLIFIIALILYGIGYAGYRYATRTYPVLYVDAVNVVAGDDLTGILTDEYVRDPVYSKRDRVEFQNGMFLSDDPSGPYFAEAHASQIKILASIAAEQLDIVLMNQDAFDAFSQNNYLTDLTELSQRSDLKYADFLSGISEDFRKNLIILSDNEMEASVDPDVTYEAETEEAMLGIDLSRTELFGPDAFPEPVYLGIVCNTPRLDEALKYVAYLYGEK